MDAKQRDFLSVMGHLYLSSGKPEKAEVVYDSLHSAFPDDDEILLALAYTKLQCGEFSKSVELIDSYISRTKAISAGAVSVRFELLIKAKALWNRGDKAKARQQMEKFLATTRMQSAAQLGEVSAASRPMDSNLNTKIRA